MKKSIGTLAVVLSVLVCQAQVLKNNTPSSQGFYQDGFDRLTQVLKQYADSQWLAGATAIVTRNGNIVYHQSFGYSNYATRKRATNSDIYRIASQTKAITSTCVLQLADKGSIFLDDPVSKYLPEFASATVLKSFNAADTTYTTEPLNRPITIRDLLTHSSGIGYALIGSPTMNALYAKAGVHALIGEPSLSLQDQVARIASVPLEHQPGKKFTYGLNTDVLGRLIEVVSGESLANYMRVHLFEPLGMYDTWFYLPTTKIQRLVAVHHAKAGTVRVIKNGDDVVPPGIDVNFPTQTKGVYSGGAGLVSTAFDYAIFMEMIANQGLYNGKRILSANSVALMSVNQLDKNVDYTFGLGFGIHTEADYARVGVSPGSLNWGGYFSSTYWIDPVEHITAQLFLNEMNSDHGEIHDRFKLMVYNALEQRTDPCRK